MRSDQVTSAYLLTQVILAVFRVNGELLSAGDRLVAGLGLTSSRWQVLGAIAIRPATVSQIGRDMGLTRQGVQRTVNALKADGFVSLASNPNHASAPLVVLTESGRDAISEATALQMKWSRSLASMQSESDLKSTLAVLEKLSASLRSESKKKRKRK